MSLSAKISGSAIVWADRGRLRPFYRAGKLLPFLTHAPGLTALATVKTVVAGGAYIVDGSELGNVPLLGKSRGHRSLVKRKGSSLAIALDRIDARYLHAGRIILVDATACFIKATTVRTMLQKLAKADVVTLPGNGAALAMTSSVLAWLQQNKLVRSAVDMADLARLLHSEGRPTHWRFAAVSTSGTVEQPLRDVASIYAGMRESRTAAALRLFEAGLGLRDPGRIELRGNLTFGRNVFIDVNTIIIGDVVLGEGVTIGPNCILEDVRIMAGSTVKEFSLVSGAQVGPCCRIGPFARIRPGTRLGRGCHIGNYVEVKNTTFGRNCKINHHSFVGDAVIGNDVIMGAGSMTSNFDGTKSKVTRIRNKAFIGSGVMLVAPVTVEQNAFVGAGTTLVAKAPATSLTLGRAKQFSIKGWKKK